MMIGEIMKSKKECQKPLCVPLRACTSLMPEWQLARAGARLQHALQCCKLLQYSGMPELQPLGMPANPGQAEELIQQTP